MLHYRTTGHNDAPPVLFLHGFLGAAADWEPIITTMQDLFHCVAVDLPGHGQSIKLRAPAYTFFGCAEAIIAVLDRLEVARCSVVGYSMGGRIALYVAHKYPERINTLVLESASPGLRTEEERFARRNHDDRLADELETEPLSRFLQRWYAQPLFETLTADKRRLQRIVMQRSNNDPFELARALRGLSTGAQPSLWSELPKINVPLLLVVGEHDAKFRTIAAQIQAIQKCVQIAVVPDVGHNVHEEAPDLFVQNVRAFLAKAS